MHLSSAYLLYAAVASIRISMHVAHRVNEIKENVESRSGDAGKKNDSPVIVCQMVNQNLLQEAAGGGKNESVSFNLPVGAVKDDVREVTLLSAKPGHRQKVGVVASEHHRKARGQAWARRNGHAGRRGRAEVNTEAFLRPGRKLTPLDTFSSPVFEFSLTAKILFALLFLLWGQGFFSQV